VKAHAPRLFTFALLGAQKGSTMAKKRPPETQAEARLRLAEEMRTLGFRIDRQPSGPERLEMLRRQAALSDQREAVSSVRH
jgi:hypothetical protein